MLIKTGYAIRSQLNIYLMLGTPSTRFKLDQEESDSRHLSVKKIPYDSAL